MTKHRRNEGKKEITDIPYFKSKLDTGGVKEKKMQNKLSLKWGG